MARRLEWHPEDIRAEVRKRLKTVATLARSTNFSLSAICQAINGRTFMPGPCLAISRAIGVSPSELWPQWFSKDDTPKLGRAAKQVISGPLEPENTTNLIVRRDQSRRAA